MAFLMGNANILQIFTLSNISEGSRSLLSDIVMANKERSEYSNSFIPSLN